MSIFQYRPKRRLIQFATLLLIAAVPASGLFRIDLGTASFLILNHPIGWSNFLFVFGLALVAATGPILTYMTIGAVWCGWACPQNLLAELANNLTYKFLGKRADVSVEGRMIVAQTKDRLVNWLLLGAIFLAASLVLGLIPFLFFFPPGEVVSFITGSSHDPIMRFMQRLYYFSAFLIFIDIAVVRYFWCDYACAYRMGQRIFKTRDALHITYDAARADECSKCSYCAANCVTGIEPTHIGAYDACIECGECIDACDRLHAPSKTKGLLDFKIGEKEGETTWREKMGEIFSRFNWLVGGLFAVGCILMIAGVIMQPPPEPQVSAAEQQKMLLMGRVCNKQCAAVQSTCTSSNIKGCLQASSCRCQCFLQQDPLNADAPSWRQCAQKYAPQKFDAQAKR